MPKYRVKNNETGQTIVLEGDAPPTEADIDQAFSDVQSQGGVFERAVSSVVDAASPLISMADAEASIASSIVSEPLSGLAGLAVTPSQGGTGGGQTVEATRDALTYKPRTEGGQAIMQWLGEKLDPVMKFIESIESGIGEAGAFVGEKVGGETGGAVGSAVGETIPTAAMMLLGGAAGKGAKGAASGADDVVRGVDDVARATDDVARASDDVVRASQVDDALRSGKVDRIAQEVLPDREVVEAAKRLDVKAGPEITTTNPQFREAAQALKSRPGSEVLAREMQLIDDLDVRAKSVIDDLGGSADRTVLDEVVRKDFLKTVDDLTAQSDDLFRVVDDAIPARSPVQPTASRAYIEQKLADLGGKKELLAPSERKLLTLLKDDEVTYAALSQLRKDVGNGFKGKGPFKDDATGTLKNVYAQLADDQARVAGDFGVGDQYLSANKLVQTRKQVEDAATGIFGKDMNRSIVQKTATAATKLAKGDTSSFKELLNAVPQHLRRDIATQVVDQLFTLGSRKATTNLGSGFGSTYASLLRNKGAKQALFRYLPTEVQQRFDDIGRVSLALQKAKARENVSRTARDVIASLDDAKVYEKLYDLAGQELVSKTPGGSLLSGVLDRTPRSVAADRLLASGKMEQAIAKIAQGDVAAAERAISNSAVFKDWLEVSPDAAKQITTVGFFAWLSSQSS